jgi:hypothetical protein
MTDTVFTQEHYSKLVRGLDNAMNVLIDGLGKTEEEAQQFLDHFVRGHYFQVWRAVNPPVKNPDQQQDSGANG